MFVCAMYTYISRLNESGRVVAESERERAQLKFNPKLLHPFSVLAAPVG